jgi:transposase
MDQRTTAVMAGRRHGGSPGSVPGLRHRVADPLPHATRVLDAFHVTRLGFAAVDDVRRRVQQESTGHRGRKHDPLYRIRRVLRRGREHLTDRQVHRLDTGLAIGDPHFEVTIAWHCYQQLRSMYQASNPAEGRRIAEQVIGSFPTCPIPEVARLGRTSGNGEATCWPASTPTRSATAAPKPST